MWLRQLNNSFILSKSNLLAKKLLKADLYFCEDIVLPHIDFVKKTGSVIFFLAILVSFTSCLSVKKFPEGAYFLKRNEIVKNRAPLNDEELRDVIKQKPNRKILGLFRVYLGIYNLGNSGDTNT